MDKIIKLKLDWLAFTFKPDRDELKKFYNCGSLTEHYNDDLIDTKSDLDLFFEFFPEFEKIQEDFLIMSGYSHYENVLGYLGVSDKCRISYNTEGYSTVEMGVNVSVPSHGLEWLFGLFDLNIDDDDAVQKLFLLLKERHCHCSRIDLAFDDFGKTFRPSHYITWWFNGNFRSHFRKMQIASTSRDIGNTFYLGSRKTGKMLRIYDKDFESDGAIDAVRYEFELHVDYARDMFQYLCDHAVVDFIAYIRSYFDICELKYKKDGTIDSRNKDKWSLLPEWKEWLDNLDFSEQLPEKVEIPKYTLSQRKTEVTSWLLNSCLRSIKGFVECFGWQNLQEAVRSDTRSIPDKYRVLLDEVQQDLDVEGFSPGRNKYSFDSEESSFEGVYHYDPEAEKYYMKEYVKKVV